MTSTTDFLDELAKKDPKAAERLRKAEAEAKAEQFRASIAGRILTPKQWDARAIEPEDFLLGAPFSTTSRGMVSAETGKGKTMLCIGIAYAAHLGRPFLHWKAGRACRVLYIDGEMPRDLMQERVRLGAGWFGHGLPADGLFFMSREDFEDMPPIDGEEWRQWIDAYVDALRPDFIILDNLMSLTVGNLKETDSWRVVDPWIKSLTRRRIGVLMVHHLGHDKSKSYGDSTREWALDYAILGEAVEDPEASVSLKLEFKKARRRRPESMPDFEPALVVLKDGVWSSTTQHKRPVREGKPIRLNEQGKLFLDATRTAIKYVGRQPPLCDETRGVTQSVTLEEVRTYWRQQLGGEPQGEDAKKEKARERQNWRRGQENAMAAGRVRCWGGLIWVP